MNGDFETLASAWRSIELDETDLLLMATELGRVDSAAALSGSTESMLTDLLRRERRVGAAWATVTMLSAAMVGAGVAFGAPVALIGLGLGGVLGGAFSTREAVRRARELRTLLRSWIDGLEESDSGDEIDFR